MEKTNITIIGAGVVGLAIASNLSKEFENVMLIERHNSFGQETSSRNSEVIHAGIYYPQNFLKGKLCLEGNEMMYDICKKYAIPHKNTGKLVIAVRSKDLERLPKILETAQKNGAKGVRIVDAKEIKKLEPKVEALGAVYCPTSGVVDTHSLMKFFEADAIKNSATVVYGVEVTSIQKENNSFIIGVRDKENRNFEFETNIVINSAGLHSDKVAAMAGVDIESLGYKINYHKGIYYRVTKKLDKYPEMLIYPVSYESGSIGIHTTPDLAGGMRLGPHFLWSDNLDYAVDDSLRNLFFTTAKNFLPFIEYDDIIPDSSGFMSSVQKPDEEMKDFIIKNEADLGFNGLINLIGIESPGLTSAPAIAKLVNKIVKDII